MIASPSTVTLILGILTVIAGFTGHYLSRRGKRDEIKMQQVAQAFAERTTAFEQVEALAERRADDAIAARTDRDKAWLEVDRVRTECEKRVDRILSRCTSVTTAATDTIADLVRFVPPDKRRIGDRMLDQIETHREDDHPESP